MVLRSDEQANESEIERDKRFRGNIGKGIATAASLGTAAVAGPLAAKVLPFLNKYIPAGLAVKGINKVSPKLGSFLKKGQEMGLDVESGLNFLKEKLGGNKPSEPAKESRNVIEQYSPELHQTILGEIQKGRSPLEAGALASMDKTGRKSFKSIIEKLEKDHKSPLSAIIQTVYGGSKQVQPQQQEAQQPGQAQQGGQGQAALMAILQKLQQSRGGQ